MKIKKMFDSETNSKEAELMSEKIADVLKKSLRLFQLKSV